MKNILTLILIFISFAAFAQGEGTMSDIRIEPNQSKNKQYIGISFNGKQLLSNDRQTAGRYDIKGHFKSILLTDLVDAIKLQVADQISDSLSASGGGGFFTTSTATDNTIQDADGNDFTLDNVANLIVEAENSVYLRTIDGGNYTEVASYTTQSELTYGHNNGEYVNYVSVDTNVNILAADNNVEITAGDSIVITGGVFTVNGLTENATGTAVMIDEATNQLYYAPVSGGTVDYYEVAFEITKLVGVDSSRIISSTFPGNITITNSQDFTTAGVGINYDDCVTIDCDGDGAGEHNWFIGGSNSATFVSFAETTFAVTPLNFYISGQGGGALLECTRPDGTPCIADDAYVGTKAKFIVRFYPD